MSIRFRDHVQEKTTAGWGGTGNVVLDGVPTGADVLYARTFVDAIGNGNQVIISIFGYDAGANPAVETCLATVISGTPDTLSRDKVYFSSAGGTTKVDFAAGVKNVVAVAPSRLFPDLAYNAATSDDDQKVVQVNQNGDGWQLATMFKTGNKIPFAQVLTAPQGWQKVTGLDGCGLRIDEADAGIVGTQAFKTCFAQHRQVALGGPVATASSTTGISIQSTVVTIQGHALTISELPSHDHDGPPGTGGFITSGTGWGVTYGGQLNIGGTPKTASKGDGAAHIHVADAHGHTPTDAGHAHGLSQHQHEIDLDTKSVGSLICQKVAA